MKNITLIVLMLLTVASINAQEEEKYPQDFEKNYELKLNTFSLIAISSLDVSYEKLINSESSYGIALFYKFTDLDNDEIGFPKRFSITPYYRWFFSENKYARGFFVEGFGMLNTYEDIFYAFNSNQDRVETATGFALGISVGGKFVTKGGFSTEVYLGVGRNLLKGNNDFVDFDIVTRFGISLGYRF